MEFGFSLLGFSIVSIPPYFVLMAILNLQFYVDFLKLIGGIGCFFVYLFSINYIKSNTYAVENVRFKTRYEFLKSNDTWQKIGICLLTGIITTIFSHFVFANFIDGLTKFQLNCIWTNLLVISLVFTGYNFFIHESNVLKFPDFQENIFWRLYNSLDMISLNKCLKLFLPFSFFHLFHAICLCPFILYLFSYFSVQNYLPDFIISMLGIVPSDINDDSGFVIESWNWYFLSLLFTSSSFLIYSLIVSQKICIIHITQPSEFMLNLNDENCLPGVLIKNNEKITNYKAWMQFFMISKYDQKARKFFYSLSHPGKHPRNWNTLLEISFKEIKSLITIFRMAVEEKIEQATHKNQVQTDASSQNFRHINSNLINPQFNKPNADLFPQFNSTNQRSNQTPNYINGAKDTYGVTGFLFSTNNQNSPNNNNHNLSPVLTSTPIERNQLGSDRHDNLFKRLKGEGNECKPKKLWEEWSEQLEFDKRILFLNAIKNRLKWGERLHLELLNFKMYVSQKANAAFTSAGQRLKRVWLYTYLFSELEDYHTKLIFSNTQKYFWIIEGITNLVCSSLDEDSYGVVQFTLVDIIELYFEILSALESWQNVSKRHHIYENQTMARQEAFFNSYLNSSIRRISFTFKQSLLSLNFKPEVINKLKPLIAGKY